MTGRERGTLPFRRPAISGKQKGASGPPRAFSHPVKTAKGTSPMQRLFVSAVAVGLLAGLAPGADVKSGPEPGKSVPVFNPLNVTGKSAGEKQCPV